MTATDPYPGDLPGRVARLAVAAYWGQRLEPGEVVHHLDGDSWNNHPDNLCVMSVRDHAGPSVRGDDEARS